MRSFSVYALLFWRLALHWVARSWSPRGRVAIDQWMHPVTGREGSGAREAEISGEDHSELVLLGKRPASQSEYPCYDQRTCSILLPCRISTPCRYPPVFAPRCRWSLNLLCRGLYARRIGLYLLRQVIERIFALFSLLFAYCCQFFENRYFSIFGIIYCDMFFFFWRYLEFFLSQSKLMNRDFFKDFYS